MVGVVDVDWGIQPLSAGEARDAFGSYEFPLAVWDEESRIVLLVNPPACELLGMGADDVVGRPAEEFLDGAKGAMVTLDELKRGVLDDLRARRRLLGRVGHPIDVLVWTRTVELDARRCALTVVLPDEEMPRLERDPTQPWRELAQTAVGRLDDAGRIDVVSREIAALVGGKPHEWVGVTLPRIVRPEDVPLVRSMIDSPAGTVAHHEVHLRCEDGSAREAWMLLAAESSGHPPNRAFAIVGSKGPHAPVDHDRVRALELRLRRIGAEVRAAGLLDVLLEQRPPGGHFPELAELSTRQWEILERLRRGDRVTDIARALFLSPSTVRNHLTSIYRRFGVHSQAELLTLLHRPPPPLPGHPAF